MKANVALSTLFVLIGLSGCVVAPAPVHRPYYAEPVLVAPPPPRVERCPQNETPRLTKSDGALLHQTRHMGRDAQ